MSDGMTAASQPGPAGARQAQLGHAYPPDVVDCARELLSIVAYLTARDGPLQTPADPGTPPSPWHERLLLKAHERLDVIDAFMRARVAFLVAGKDRGYHTPPEELDLAGTTLDATRATAVVVDHLLKAQLPSRHEFDTMSLTALRVHPALAAAQQVQGAQTR